MNKTGIKRFLERFYPFNTNNVNYDIRSVRLLNNPADRRNEYGYIVTFQKHFDDCPNELPNDINGCIIDIINRCLKDSFFDYPYTPTVKFINHKIRLIISQLGSNFKETESLCV